MNWISSVPQTAATTFDFSSVFILLLLWAWCTWCRDRRAFLVLRSHVPGILGPRERKFCTGTRERAMRKNRNANFAFLKRNKEHICEVNITCIQLYALRSELQVYFFYSLCVYTVVQIAELTARGDSFMASIWRAAHSLKPLNPPPPIQRV